jgi:hypothetical protein
MARIISPPNSNIMFKLRSLRLDGESLVVLMGTVFVAGLLFLTAIDAGPLWRDEVNTANVAQMPTLHALWQSLPCESFPPLWPLLLRGGNGLGLGGGDGSIRVLGLYVGLFFLGALWLSTHWLGCRAPTLSIGLLGCLPVFIFIIGSNRAYGLACGLLVLTFGALWRMVECPSKPRILLAALASFLYVHCVYYDAVFLAAMLAGGAAVTLRRRQWKLLGLLVGIGLACAISLFLYWPIIRQGSNHPMMARWPGFNFAFLWAQIADAVTARSSAAYGPHGYEIWLWIALLAGGLLAALAVQKPRIPPTSSAAPAVQRRAELALFCSVSMLIGAAGLLSFLYRLQFPTEKWYYMEMLCLCAVSLDGLLGANWSAWRPWGLLRVCLMLATMAWFMNAAWSEAHTRRSNVDLIAAVLNKSASDKDLIVVENAWEGITFNRYYNGTAHWVTVPPLASHLVHRNDLMFERMGQPEALAPVLTDITNTLAAGHAVWLLGRLSNQRPEPLRPKPSSEWLGAYLLYWNTQVSAALLDHATQQQVLEIAKGERVSYLEDIPAIRFQGYRSGEGYSPKAEK